MIFIMSDFTLLKIFVYPVPPIVGGLPWDQDAEITAMSAVAKALDLDELVRQRVISWRQSLWSQPGATNH